MISRNWTSELSRSHFFRFALVFLAVTGAVSILTGASTIPFGTANFWDTRGILWGSCFLVLITFFPRLTLLLSSVPTGGFLWWVGFIFAPRVLVAALATVQYWKQNPILIVIAWLVALGGESTEKSMLGRRRQWRSWYELRGFGRRPAAYQDANHAGRPGAAKSGKDKTVEAEYRVTD